MAVVNYALALAAAVAHAKLGMVSWTDKIDGSVCVRFDREPRSYDEQAFRDALKEHGFSWTGYKETGKWKGKQASVEAFIDKTFRARLKQAVGNFSFFGPTNNQLDLMAFVEAVRAINPDDADDDLSSLGSSSMTPNVTPTKDQNKRPRT